ncbi:MAG TPA: hypothetical protein PKK43_01240 [Spirochaetota bacterium]|nr:hypothetical protein [Spirochaetota bacterium]
MPKIDGVLLLSTPFDGRLCFFQVFNATGKPVSCVQGKKKEFFSEEVPNE